MLIDVVITVVVAVIGAVVVTRATKDVAAAGGISVFASDDASAVVVMADKGGAEGGVDSNALAPSVITIVADSALTSNSVLKLCTLVVAGRILRTLIGLRNSLSLSRELELNAELEVFGVVVAESITFHRAVSCHLAPWWSSPVTNDNIRPAYQNGPAYFFAVTTKSSTS